MATEVYGSLQLGSRAPPGPGYTIKVYKQKVGGTKTLVGSYKTNSAGYFYAYLKFTSTGQWYVWAEFAGFGGLYKSSSGKMVMQAWSSSPPAKTPSNVVTWASAQRVHKSAFTLSGFAETARSHFVAGKTVYLRFAYKAHLSNPSWSATVQLTGKTDNNGHWSIPFTAQQYGYYKFWAVYPGDTKYLASTSNELIVWSAVG